MLFIPFRPIIVIRISSDRVNVSFAHQKAVFFSKKEKPALSEHACVTNHEFAWENSNYDYHQSTLPSKTFSGNLAY